MAASNLGFKMSYVNTVQVLNNNNVKITKKNGKSYINVFAEDGGESNHQFVGGNEMGFMATFIRFSIFCAKVHTHESTLARLIFC